ARVRLERPGDVEAPAGAGRAPQRPRAVDRAHEPRAQFDRRGPRVPGLDQGRGPAHVRRRHRGPAEAEVPASAAHGEVVDAVPLAPQRGVGDETQADLYVRLAADLPER